MILFAFLLQICVGGCITRTNKVTPVLQLVQDQIVFSVFTTGSTFSTSFRSGVGVGFVVFMSLWAVRFVGIEVSPSLDYIPHVVCLRSTFQVVWVYAYSIVTFVSYDWWIVVVSHKEGEAVCSLVSVVYIQLPVTVPPT